MSTCDICCEDRPLVTCASCSKGACRSCHSEFFLGSINEPVCMHCDKEFDLEFLLGSEPGSSVPRFKKSFVWGPLREHREDMLIDRIMLRMPEYIPLARSHRIIEKNKKLVKKIEARQELLKHNRYQIPNVKDGPFRADRRVLLERFSKLEWKKVDLNDEIEDERFFITNGRYPGENEVEEHEKKRKQDLYVNRGRCPDDDCNGFIQDEWKCGLCDLKVCSKCMVKKEKEHECKQEDIDTVKLLRKDFKPCPNCRCNVEKVSGCYQMWCVHCHTFFDWGNLKILKPAYIHNPDHDEFLRTNGDDRLNLPGEVNPICGFSINELSGVTGVDRELLDKLRNEFRFANEVADEVARYTDPLEKRNEIACIKYLNGEYKKLDLKTFIQRHYKASKKAEYANQRRSMYSDTTKHIIILCVTDAKAEKSNLIKKDICEKAIDSIMRLQQYTEKSLETIGDIFNSQKPHLSTTKFKQHTRRRKHVVNILANPGLIGYYHVEDEDELILNHLTDNKYFHSRRDQQEWFRANKYTVDDVTKAMNALSL